MYLLFKMGKMGIFRCYVSLPEGRFHYHSQFRWSRIPRDGRSIPSPNEGGRCLYGFSGSPYLDVVPGTRYDQWDPGMFFWNIGLNHGMKTGDSLGMYLKDMPDTWNEYTYRYDMCILVDIHIFNYYIIPGTQMILVFNWKGPFLQEQRALAGSTYR